MWGIIATWRMSLEGVNKASALLAQNNSAEKAIITAIKDVEDNPYFKSVGYGGLPNEDGIVELDAAFMNGKTLQVGAVAGMQNIANPIEVAYQISFLRVNNFLVGEGAQKYALENGFKRSELLSERAKFHYKERLKATNQEIKPYIGHDTVGMCNLDSSGHMCAATSTSGLFMKKQGRVGDSPLCGSGFYANEEIGCASATGLGEDIMKGCISYEIVSLMQHMSPQQACEKAVHSFQQRMMKTNKECGDISVISMNCQGEWGVYTTIQQFPFVVASENQAATVYIAYHQDNQFHYEKATKEWLTQYDESTKKYIIREYD